MNATRGSAMGRRAPLPRSSRARSLALGTYQQLLVTLDLHRHQVAGVDELLGVPRSLGALPVPIITSLPAPGLLSPIDR